MKAIYQRARPYTFEQVVGQEHVKDVLTVALQKGRLGHAYLFSGPRGVGKTTTARLVAMAVNCRAEQAEKPCGECESCLMVRRGNHPDVIELDAASNNSVEDIRDLREKVRLAAVHGGSRVWVLDEAHMLSKSASNALLKTLEEPPPKLVFVLATTEPEKLPATILSRCQHYRFRRLVPEEIVSKLERLVTEAEVEAEPAALQLVARAADGAMRDAESLLERLLTTGEPISEQRAEDALGLPPAERIQGLATALVTGNLTALFSGASELYHDGFAPRSIAEHLKMSLRDALYTQLGLDRDFRLNIEQDDLLRVIHALDDEAERFVRYNDLFSLEVALLKAHNSLINNAPADATAEPSGAQVTPTAPVPEKAAGGSLPDFDPNGRAAPPRRSKDPPAATAATSAETPSVKINWHQVLSKAGAQLKAFMTPAKAEIDGRRIYLHYGEKYKFHLTEVKKRQAELTTLVHQVLGPDIQVFPLGPGDRPPKKP